MKKITLQIVIMKAMGRLLTENCILKAEKIRKERGKKSKLKGKILKLKELLKVVVAVKMANAQFSEKHNFLIFS